MAIADGAQALASARATRLARAGGAVVGLRTGEEGGLQGGGGDVRVLTQPRGPPAALAPSEAGAKEL